MALIEGHKLVLDSANPGSAPVAPVMDNRTTVRDKSYMSIEHNISTKTDTNSFPVFNAQKENTQQYVNNAHVNFTGREQSYPTIVQQANLKGHSQWQNLSVFSARTTTNETTNYSYSGNPENQNQGQNFYRYDDKPRTTTNETTNYSYSGNPENQNQGQNFYRYDDKPRTTTKETTNYSYAGDPTGTVNSHNPTNRNQFTGDYMYDEKTGNYYNPGTSGVTKWSSKSSTLVEDYFPSANGSVNYQQDAINKIGTAILKPDNDSVAIDGPGTLNRTAPNATRFTRMDKAFIGEQRINPNKLFAEDTRQIADYQITALKNNGLSIYRNLDKTNNEKNNSIPTFFIDENKQKYSDFKTETIKVKDNKNLIERSKANDTEYKFGEVSVNSNNTNNINPNADKVFNTFNQQNKNIENPLLFSKRVKNNNNNKLPLKNRYPGLGYSGTAVKANNDNLNSGLNGVYLDYQVNEFKK